VPGHAVRFDQLRHHGDLPGAGVLEAFDLQLGGAQARRCRFAPAHQRDLDSAPDQHLHAESVRDVEALQFHGVPALGAPHVEAAVRQYAIYIEKGEADPARQLDGNALTHGRRRLRPVPATRNEWRGPARAAAATGPAAACWSRPTAHAPAPDAPRETGRA